MAPLNNDVQAIQHVQEMMDSPGGKVLWALSKILVTVLITALVAISTSKLSDISESQKDQTAANIRQDQNIILLQQRTDALQKVSDATVVSLQQIGNQVTHNTDDIGHIKDIENYRVSHSRPPQ